MKRLLDESIAPEMRDLLRSAEKDGPPAPKQRQDRILAAIAGASAAAAVAVTRASTMLRVAKWTVPALGIVGLAWVITSSRTSESPPSVPPEPPAMTAPAADRAAARPEPQAPPPSAAIRVEDLPTVVSARPVPTTPRAPERSVPSTEEPSIDAELAAIDAARGALTAQRAGDALARVLRYRATFATPHFADEADAIEVQALAALGRTDEARAKAETFLAMRPRSPYAQRVRAAVGMK